MVVLPREARYKVVKMLREKLPGWQFCPFIFWEQLGTYQCHWSTYGVSRTDPTRSVDVAGYFPLDDSVKSGIRIFSSGIPGFLDVFPNDPFCLVDKPGVGLMFAYILGKEIDSG